MLLYVVVIVRCSFTLGMQLANVVETAVELHCKVEGV